ncbi:MAG: MgtC/SapB family protein [Nitrosomonas sp.]|nr:MgtC/SapB family protein [Nitrosomonas sp.]
MEEYIQYIQNVIAFDYLASLLLAFLITLPIGWEREKDTHSIGMRTFPLVSLASCGYMLIGQSIVSDDPEALAKILYGLMTGIGFIGGGAILKLKEEASVHGTATAASIWNTGAIGAAVAFQRYEIAIALAVVNFAALRFVPKLKKKIVPIENPKN